MRPYIGERNSSHSSLNTFNICVVCSLIIGKYYYLLYGVKISFGDIRVSKINMQQYIFLSVVLGMLLSI